jgi:hypothetical protein
VAKPGDMPAEVALILHLRKQLKVRRQEHLEKLGNGMKRRDAQEHVGRAKELKWLLDDLLGKRLRQLDFDGDDDDQQSNARSSRRPTP